MPEMKCKVCLQEPDREHQVFVSTPGGWLCKKHYEPYCESLIDWNKVNDALKVLAALADEPTTEMPPDK